MIDGVNMARNHQKLQYIKRMHLLDQVIELDMQERKSIPRTIGKYAHIICDAKNPYNAEFLKRFPRP